MEVYVATFDSKSLRSAKVSSEKSRIENSSTAALLFVFINKYKQQTCRLYLLINTNNRAADKASQRCNKQMRYIPH